MVQTILETPVLPSCICSCLLGTEAATNEVYTHVSCVCFKCYNETSYFGV